MVKKQLRLITCAQYVGKKNTEVLINRPGVVVWNINDVILFNVEIIGYCALSIKLLARALVMSQWQCVPRGQVTMWARLLPFPLLVRLSENVCIGKFMGDDRKDT